MWLLFECYIISVDVMCVLLWVHVSHVLQAQAGTRCLDYLKMFYDENIGRKSVYFLKVV